MRGLGLFVIGLIFGGGIGFLTAVSQDVTLEGHDHGNPAHHGAEAADHDAHGVPLDLPAQGAPEVAIEVMPDPVSGYNLQVKAQNFAFAPAQAGRANAPGEGHAHIYVNGRKLSRLYGDWMHLAALPQGAVEVKVSLNANDHRPLTVAGKEIAAQVTIDVQ
ncbi:MAG: hypothetical protein ACSHWZ_01085 [Sulfitobacter sp.]